MFAEPGLKNESEESEKVGALPLISVVMKKNLRNAAGARDDSVPSGIMAKARRFAVVQLAREDDADKETSHCQLLIYF